MQLILLFIFAASFSYAVANIFRMTKNCRITPFNGLLQIVLQTIPVADILSCIYMAVREKKPKKERGFHIADSDAFGNVMKALPFVSMLIYYSILFGRKILLGETKAVFKIDDCSILLGCIASLVIFVIAAVSVFWAIRTQNDRKHLASRQFLLSFLSKLTMIPFYIVTVIITKIIASELSSIADAIIFIFVIIVFLFVQTQFSLILTATSAGSLSKLNLLYRTGRISKAKRNIIFILLLIPAVDIFSSLYLAIKEKKLNNSEGADIATGSRYPKTPHIIGMLILLTLASVQMIFGIFLNTLMPLIFAVYLVALSAAYMELYLLAPIVNLLWVYHLNVGIPETLKKPIMVPVAAFKLCNVFFGLTAMIFGVIASVTFVPTLAIAAMSWGLFASTAISPIVGALLSLFAMFMIFMIASLYGISKILYMERKHLISPEQALFHCFMQMIFIADIIDTFRLMRLEKETVKHRLAANGRITVSDTQCMPQFISNIPME